MPLVRSVSFAVAFAVALAACDAGPTAEAPGEIGEACAETSFCIGLPEGWTVTDVGRRHVTISHSDGPDATVAFVEMGRVIASAGGVWPQDTERAVRSLWALFDGGEARLERIEEQPDGSVRSEGNISTGKQFHLLVPLDGDRGVGVVVRAPNGSWRSHADAIFAGLRLR